ncbi:hypothetical protein Sden_2213 [Shewanella denitrificans OS217]|uniref:Uncharacterized protein n=1 Tax=Shewanella denitrificans (strain OS217 / ATCC BAA-1090 / DSM 15013) TaxID=318161 RepID=Q12M33_SHEDO|nr:hypothetical protein [Shewanella denitrificans]ABE55493.1 hypothetical protein Sden_2213 [Shewanella denitrificans OS217]
MDIRKSKKVIFNALYAFIGLFALAGLSGRIAYVPLENLELTLFLMSSIIIFTLLIWLMATYKGTKSQPTGFKQMALLIKERKVKEVLIVIVFLPLVCFLIGYCVSALVVTIPALPTKIFTHKTEIKQTQCIKTGSDKVRGDWSIFKLSNGEEWKVAGYGKICPSNERSCTLKYSEGYLGYYIRDVMCS